MALTQVSTDGIKDLSVKNADIASAAAIVGTKISPDFGSQNIVTTGNASVAGITATADIDLQDDDKILLGTDDDLQLYHNGSHSYIDETGQGNLYIKSSGLWIRDSGNGGIQNGDGTDNHIQWHNDGNVELYYDGSKKFETLSTGWGVPSTIEWHATQNSLDFYDSKKASFGSSRDLQIYHDGSQSYIVNTTSDLYIQCASDENAIETNQNAGVKLYYDGGKKFETTSGGVKVIGDLHFDNGTNAGQDIFWDESSSLFNFEDDVKATFGDNGDLQLYHDGSHSFIHQDGVGSLYILADTFRLNNEANTENIIAGNADGQVQLYYDNSKKIQTASHGIDIVDDLVFDNGTNAGKDINWNESSNTMRWQDEVIAAFGIGDDLKIYHDGSHSRIKNTTGYLILQSSTGILLKNDTDDENFIVANDDGSVELCYDGNKKFETNSTGAFCTGQLGCDTLYMGDDDKGKFGGDDDLQIFHENSSGVNRIDSYVDLYLRKGASENMAKFHIDGGIKLYYDGDKKLETTTSGITVQGSVTTEDINLSNLSAVSPNEVDGTRGNWTMQEGADDLFLINRVNGKKYKFNLTEVG